MAKTSYIQLNSAQEEAYYNILTSGDRFIVPRVRRKVTLMSRTRKKGVSQRSLLPLCSEKWQNFTTEEKAAWNSAAAYSNTNGWRLFVQDYCYRIKNDLEGIAIPNEYHQALVGQLTIEAPADELKIIQPHPNAYYIEKKVSGHKSMYVSVEVMERLILPLTIGLSYKSDLELTEAGGYAKMYAIVRRLYQGRNINTELSIDLDLQTDWKKTTNTLNSVLGQYTSYALYFHLHKVRGTLLVDNLQALHSAQNWTRDFRCNRIQSSFTRAFYQIPRHWAPLILPEGSFFGSVYPM